MIQNNFGIQFPITVSINFSIFSSKEQKFNRFNFASAKRNHIGNGVQLIAKRFLSISAKILKSRLWGFHKSQFFIPSMDCKLKRGLV